TMRRKGTVSATAVGTSITCSCFYHIAGAGCGSGQSNPGGDMMLTRLTAVSAIALTCSLAAFAQTPTTPTPPSQPTKPWMPEPAKPPMTQSQTYNSGADAQKLIGRNIKNLQDQTIGEIKSVHLDSDGKVDQVIVSVGGFLGIGDREVAINWKDLNI